MAQRKIVWTKKANIERKEILEYWIDKNKSARFSKKLNLLFVESLKQICIYPNLGRKTSDEKTRVIIVRNYLIFYEFNEKRNHHTICLGWQTQHKIKSRLSRIGFNIFTIYPKSFLAELLSTAFYILYPQKLLSSFSYLLKQQPFSLVR